MKYNRLHVAMICFFASLIDFLIAISFPVKESLGWQHNWGMIGLSSIMLFCAIYNLAKYFRKEK